MIDWDKYKSATSVDIVYRDGGIVIDTCRVNRPTQKTVADAVKQYGGKWQHEDYKFLHWLPNDGWLFTSNGKYFGRSESQVCTREQFEDYVKEQEGEKWTHDFYGDRCKVLISKQDAAGEIVILLENGNYSTVGDDEVKPIKSTISTSSALAIMATACPDEWTALQRKYDIT